MVLHLAGAFGAVTWRQQGKSLSDRVQPAPVWSVFVTVSFSATSHLIHSPSTLSILNVSLSHLSPTQSSPSTCTTYQPSHRLRNIISNRLQCESNECSTKWYNTCCRKRSHFSVSSFSVSLIFPFSLSLLPILIISPRHTRISHLPPPLVLSDCLLLIDIIHSNCPLPPPFSVHHVFSQRHSRGRPQPPQQRLGVL